MIVLAVTSTLTLLLTNCLTYGAAIGDVDLDKLYGNALDNEDVILYRDLGSRAAEILTNRGILSDYVASLAKQVCTIGVDGVNAIFGRKRDAVVDDEDLESRAAKILTDRSILSDALASLGKGVCNDGIDWLKEKFGHKRLAALDDEICRVYGIC